MLRRYIKYGTVIAIAGGTAISLNNNDYEVASIGILRVGRAALTTYSIARVYQTQLFNKNYDKKTPEYAAAKKEAHLEAAKKLLDLCTTNKGVYVKVGQHIGAMEYILPTEYVQTMKVLHCDAPSSSLDVVYKVIKDDLKKDPNQMFDDFDPKPLGAASLAQVHKAKLKDGTVVAVKVQHAFVKGNIKIDLKVMESLIKIMSWVFPEFQMQWLVDVTKKNIFNELNFLKEGQNAEKLSQMCQNFTWLKIPKIFWDYSTERVLVMEFVEGGQVNDYEYIKNHNINPFDLSKKLGDLYSQMIFVNGFVHSDPHPGNILVKKDPGDKDVTVYLIDHGLYATLTKEFQHDYSKFWMSIINRDRKNMRRNAEKLGIKGDLYFVLACMVTGRPWQSIEKGIDRVKPGSLGEKNEFQTEVPNFLTDITSCLEHVDRQALLVLKTNDLIRGIEFALGTHQRMCGFITMTKYIMMFNNNEEQKNANTLFKKAIVNLKRSYLLFWYYIYYIVTEIRFRYIL